MNSDYQKIFDRLADVYENQMLPLRIKQVRKRSLRPNTNAITTMN